jgi:coenzyme F420 hydrogenase subunit beta
MKVDHIRIANKTAKSGTIAGVIENNLCTGCATCISLCPKSAIKLVKNNSKGIYLPQIEGAKCDQCGTCYRVCPGHSVNFEQLNTKVFGKKPKDTLIGNYHNCYIGHATDYSIRYNSASGGLVTAILIFLLEEKIVDGALVTRMSNEDPLEPYSFIARTRQEILSAAGSKYCPVPANVALKEILSTKRKYAVVGLPCHIHGIRKAEMANKELLKRIILHMGLFCGGVCSFKGTEFLLDKMDVDSKEIKDLKYRGEGWPGSMVIQLRNGSRKQLPITEYWGNKDDTFGSFILRRCMLCIDSISELADISFGDAWLPETSGEMIGESIIVTRKMESENILQKMIEKEEVEVDRVSGYKVIQSQGGRYFRKKVAKARFLIYKSINKKLPIYDQELPQSQPVVYLSVLWLRFRMFLASKRCLWRVLSDVSLFVEKCRALV